MSKRNTTIAAFHCLVICLLMTTGCKDSPPQIAQDAWFPMVPGWQWHYQTIKTNDEAVTRDTYQIENLPAVEHFDQRYLVRRDQHGTRFYFSRDDSGTHRIGKQAIVSADIQFDRKPRLVLPKPLDSTKTWFIDSHPYVLERVAPVRETFTRENTFQMSFEVINRNATITVPAGTFDNCIHVRGVGTATVLADLNTGRYGASDAEITTEEWYAEGVGMVKLRRQEHFPHDLFIDGSFVMELLELDKTFRR